MTAPALDFDDPIDLADAERGLVGRLEPCVIRDGDGRTVWDVSVFGFLDADCPQTAHPALWRHCRLTRLHGLYEVAEGVYQVRGMDLSNMTIIEGETGILVIDPLLCRETAAAALALYREHRGDRPMRAVFYSHSHADHFGGVRGVLPDDASADGVPIVAPVGFLEHAVSENVVAGPAMARRAAYMYGGLLPTDPAGHIGNGIGQAMSSGTVGLIPPTLLITETGQRETFDGVELVFQLTPGTEAPSEMNFHLPARRVLLVAENASHGVHNVLTPRGAQIRDAAAWARYLTETIRLHSADSDVLLGSHHWPTYGSERLTAYLELQRDAYAYTHDQSVRLMNRGYTGPEIAEALELPPALASCWHVQGFYGSHNNNAKAVYQRYMGWFDGNPSHLWQHPPVEQAVRYVAAIGGADAVLEQADAAHRAGDFRWAAELLNHLLFAEPEHPDARELQARTFEQLAYATDNGPWRSFYLTGALELRDGVRKTPLSLAPDLVAALTTEQIFQAMSVRVDGPRAAAARLVIRWCYTDPDERWTLILANGVLVAHRGEGPHGARPQVTITVSRAVHNEILGLRTTFLDQVVAGTVTIEGDANVLLEFNGYLEEPERSFPIVTP